MSEQAAHIFSRLQKLQEQLPYLPQTIRLVRSAARAWMGLWLALLIAQGLLPAAVVNLTRLLVDTLVDTLGMESDQQSFRPALMLVLILTTLLLLTELLRSATAYVRTVQAELVQDHISRLIQEKSAEVDLAFYDTPAYFDRLHRARYEATSRPLALLESMGSLLQNGITLVAMLLVLLPYGLWLPAALVISSLPAFYVVLRQRVRLHQWRLRSTEAERKAWYYFWMLTARETAAELRLFDLAAYFRKQFDTVRHLLRRERIRLAREQGIAELGAGLSALLVTGVVTIWMVWRMVQGAVSLGDLTLFYQAFNQGQRLTRSLLDNLGEIYANTLFLADLFEFLAFENVVQDPPDPRPFPASTAPAINVEYVTFRYPGSRRIALDDFSLSLPSGRISALVGPNGAGKSTLIKLLCRLYDPEAGRVLVEGVDIRSLRQTDLRRMIAVLFQEPVRHNATVRENIWLGNREQDLDGDSIVQAAIAAGADTPVEGLSRGYDTLLGRQFSGGTELSVGEWQRLALARAYLRQAPFIILDEPTSAMDPWAEADWLRRFRRLAQERTALIITHRFTTAMYADTISVMEQGRIVEQGAHDELLISGGMYSRSWHAQMQQQVRVEQAVANGSP